LSSTRAAPNFSVSAPDGAITRQADGSYLAVWISGRFIKGQVFDAMGAKQGAEFDFAFTTNLSDIGAATLSDGRIILSWTSEGLIRKMILKADHTPDDPHNPVQIVDWDGMAAEASPKVYALDEGGGHAIVYKGTREGVGDAWYGMHIMPRTATSRDDLLSPDDSDHASAVLTSGLPLVVYANAEGDLQVEDLLNRSLINRIATDKETYHSVTALPGDRAVVTWEDHQSFTDTNPVIRAQVYGPDHASEGDPIIFKKPPGVILNTTVAQLADGRLAMVLTMDEHGDSNIYVSTCSADGKAVSGPVLVGQGAAGSQTDPIIIPLADNKFVIGWTHQIEGQGPQFMTEVFNDPTLPDNAAPQITNLNGDSISTTPGGTALIDVGSNAVLSDDHGAIQSLVVHLWDGETEDHLGIRTENTGITLSNGLNPGSKISIGTDEIGVLDNVSDQWLLGITFHTTATVAQVQQLIRALIYSNSSNAADLVSQRHIQIGIQDRGGKSVRADVTIDVAPVANNTAPTITVEAGKQRTQASDDGPSVKPFEGVTFADGPEDDTLTVRISFKDSDGTLILPAGVEPDSVATDMGNRTYTFTGKAGALTDLMDNLLFDPVERPVAQAGSHHVTTFSLAVTDLAHATPDEDFVQVDTTVANRAPTGSALGRATVAENAATGTRIGDLSATDQYGAAFTYSLVGDAAGGRFKVVGNELQVANGTLLDYEQARSHTVRVKVSDEGGLSFEKDFTIAVTDIMEAVPGGTKARNVLVGGMGADRINGGSGNDTLTGGAGADVFVFDTALGKGTNASNQNKKVNFDTIADFKSGEDRIWLDNRIFKTLGKGSEAAPGALNPKFFRLGKAKDKNDYLAYKDGVVSFDADGSGTRYKPVEFIKIANKAKLTAADFLVV